MVYLDISPMCDRSLHLELWTGHRGMHPHRELSEQSQTQAPYPTLIYCKGRMEGMEGMNGMGFQVPMGPQGQRGDTGATVPQGPPGPRSGGVVYTRWGKTSCPNVSGTELVYAGRAGGTYHTHKGGAANYFCIPDDPDHLCYGPRVQGNSYVYGVEYEMRSGQPFFLFSTTMRSLCCVLCFNEGGSHNDPS